MTWLDEYAAEKERKRAARKPRVTQLEIASLKWKVASLSKGTPSSWSMPQGAGWIVKIGARWLSTTRNGASLVNLELGANRYASPRAALMAFSRVADRFPGEPGIYFVEGRPK